MPPIKMFRYNPTLKAVEEIWVEDSRKSGALMGVNMRTGQKTKGYRKLYNWLDPASEWVDAETLFATRRQAEAAAVSNIKKSDEAVQARDLIHRHLIHHTTYHPDRCKLFAEDIVNLLQAQYGLDVFDVKPDTPYAKSWNPPNPSEQPCTVCGGKVSHYWVGREIPNRNGRCYTCWDANNQPLAAQTRIQPYAIGFENGDAYLKRHSDGSRWVCDKYAIALQVKLALESGIESESSYIWEKPLSDYI